VRVVGPLERAQESENSGGNRPRMRRLLRMGRPTRRRPGTWVLDVAVHSRCRTQKRRGKAKRYRDRGMDAAGRQDRRSPSKAASDTTHKRAVRVRASSRAQNSQATAAGGEGKKIQPESVRECEKERNKWETDRSQRKLVGPPVQSSSAEKRIITTKDLEIPGSAFFWVFWSCRQAQTSSSPLQMGGGEGRKGGEGGKRKAIDYKSVYMRARKRRTIIMGGRVV
jgi:hypothetical protein